jgi:uncharacterized protein (TIGR03083 family)
VDMSIDDEVTEWRAAVERVCSLVAAASEEELGRHVPAAPDWTVRDLLSHMVGLGADVLAGDEPDDHNEAWTQAQVDDRLTRSASELVVEWRSLVEPMSEWMRENGTRPLGDVIIHEQDLRSTLGRPGARDSAGLHAVRDKMAARFARAATDMPPLGMVASDNGWRWVSDGSDPSGVSQSAAVLVEAPAYDLFRALTSRRTADQLRSWTRRGDIAGYLRAFAGLGPLPTQPLPE